MEIPANLTATEVWKDKIEIHHDSEEEHDLKVQER